MSDQENPDSSPKPKRTRLSSERFQDLSLPPASIPASRQKNPSRKSATQLPSWAPAPAPPPFPEPMFISPIIDNRIARAGVIKKLKLTNFICHENFEIDLNPRINFISGANGSGKSAIQRAIVIGLGGQASKTNRSSEIEGLIKHGCDSGSVAITLTNTDSNAYKPEIYGNEIKIVRNLTPSASTYKIYNQWDKVISDKKEELDLITTRFNIQPNNLVSILNQDLARNILSWNTAEITYQMFKKATLLDEAEKYLNNINAQIVEMKESIADKEKTEELIDREIAVMDQKMQLIERLEETKKRKKELKDELVWCEVHVIREDLIRLQDICEEQQNNKHDLEETLDEINEKIAEESRIIEELQRTLVSLQTQSRSKEEFCQKNKSHLEKCVECQQICDKIKHKKLDKDQIKDSIEKEAQSKFSKLQDLLEEQESRMKILQQEISRFRQTLAAVEVNIIAKKYLDKCGIGDTAFQQNQISKEIENLKKGIEIARGGKKCFEKKIEDVNIKIASLKSRIEQAIKKIEEKRSEVSTYSQSQEPDEEHIRSIREVREEIKQCDAFIAEAERRIGTESITFEKDYITKQIAQRKFKKMFAELKKTAETYQKMTNERKETIYTVRDLRSEVVFARFEKFVSSINYRGKMVFDHNKGKLAIKLAPPDSGDSFVNSESLSGSEKSLSKVAFSMALWSNMDSPFYSMDEYGVLMDPFSRIVITRLLTSFATDESSRQFIFFTPVDVSYIKNRSRCNCSQGEENHVMAECFPV